MALFNRRNDGTEPENKSDRARSSYVPASMRERPAPAIMSPDELDNGHDQEIEFLSKLVNEIDHGPAPQSGGAPRVDTARVDVREDDEMWAFREVDPQTERYDNIRRHVGEDVEIGDLLDELNVTAAALRRRRAA